ncbi:MAG: hypothetical protein IKE76_11780 [Clostridia bacterium]|nr:hypothetical protein [Clostridia bacterium]
MSNKSKRQPKRKSSTRLYNESLAVFLWAWISKTSPGEETVQAVSAEIRNVVESLSATPKRVSIDMIVKQLEEEHGIRTDWLRRDRG